MKDLIRKHQRVSMVVSIANQLAQSAIFGKGHVSERERREIIAQSFEMAHDIADRGDAMTNALPPLQAEEMDLNDMHFDPSDAH